MREKSIKYWNAEERPREKLIAKGKEALTNAELLAILISAGYKEKSALDVAYEILEKVNEDLNLLSRWKIPDFKQIKGIGDAKAVTLMAVFELARRRALQEVFADNKITSTKDAGRFLLPILNDNDHERFYVLYLNNSHRVIHHGFLSQGGLTSTVVDIRLLLKTALQYLATTVIISHNHPSGNLIPSQADRKLTEKLKIACSYLDIKLLDHIIIGGNKYLSFADEGYL